MNETITLKFRVSGQDLKPLLKSPFYASNTVSYINASFDLSDEWQEFDSVSAVWKNNNATVAVLLDTDFNCIVPAEVLSKVSPVSVNLVGSTVIEGVLVDRLTTYPVHALTVHTKAIIAGDETPELTPSQFEQFLNMSRNKVITEVQAETLDEGEDATAVYSNGIMTFGLPKGDRGETGNGIASVEKTETTGNVDTYTITFTDGDTMTFDVTNGNVSSVNSKSGAVILTATDISYSAGNSVGNAISTLDSRITSLATLTEGSTTGDAELIDGRTGADSVTYANIGTAIRTQVSDLKSDIDGIDDVLGAEYKPFGKLPTMVAYNNEGNGTLVDDNTLTFSNGANVLNGRIGKGITFTDSAFVGKKFFLKFHYNNTGDTSKLKFEFTKQSGNDASFTVISNDINNPIVLIDATDATFDGIRYHYMYAMLQGNGSYTVNQDTTIHFDGYEVLSTEKTYSELSEIKANVSLLDESLITDALTVNLIDSNEIESNYYYRASDGAKTNGGNYLSSTGLIPVEEGKTYTINMLASTQPHWTCWDENLQFVTGSQSSGYSYTIPTGQNIAYLRASFLLANEATVMIVEGNDIDYNNYYAYGHPAKYAKTQWYKKKVSMIGDSLTQMGYWEPMFASILGLNDYEIIAQYGGNMTAIANFVSQLDNDNDLLTVWAGTNDFANNIALGEFGSSDVNTYAGALGHVIEYCSTNYPLMKLLLITPMQRFDTVVSGWERDSKGNYINPTTNKTLEDYANMVLTYGSAYAIPVLDMYHASGFNEFNASAYSDDLLHPSRPGFQRLCWKIIEKAKGL